MSTRFAAAPSDLGSLDEGHSEEEVLLPPQPVARLVRKIAPKATERSQRTFLVRLLVFGGLGTVAAASAAAVTLLAVAWAVAAAV